MIIISLLIFTVEILIETFFEPLLEHFNDYLLDVAWLDFFHIALLLQSLDTYLFRVHALQVFIKMILFHLHFCDMRLLPLSSFSIGRWSSWVGDIFDVLFSHPEVLCVVF